MTFDNSILDKYCAQIPYDLWDLLLPKSDHDREELITAVKKLRFTQEERNYVLDLQHRHRLPIRPNESIKRTMIRARLARLKSHRRSKKPGRNIRQQQLPKDPLE